MGLHCYSLERFIESIHSLEEGKPDRVVAMGYLDGHHGGIQMDEKNYKRLADFIFPAELFADPETLDDIRDATKDLVVSGVIPSKMLDTEHPNVLSYEEYRDLARDAAEGFDDPMFLTGHFHAGRKYRMYGNTDNDKPRHYASMHFPEEVFTAAGTAPLKKMSSGYPGTIVLEAEKLSEDARALGRGEIDEIQLDEREDDSMDPEKVYDTLTGLSPGDRVRVNDRERAMTVIPREETRRRGYSNAECLFLSGNGTDYLVTLEEDDYGKLEWTSDSEYITSVEVVERADTEQETVVA